MSRRNLTVRGAVWHGDGTGKWWADVYYSTNPVPVGRVFERDEVDAAPGTGGLIACLDTRDEAIAYAEQMVGELRFCERARRVAMAGTMTTAEAAEALGGLFAVAGNPEPLEAP